ncbi:MAG: tetratricopeptide repeat protein [Bacteroidetes bacterium]|nr:tetratricopeptide repeat protein [Bacteroidota bacterium]
MNLSYKTIELFLQKQLPEREMEAIERHLKHNPLDAEMVANIADALQAGITIDELKQSENQFKRSIGLPKLQQRKAAVLRISRVAAAILILALPSYFILSSSNSNAELYQTYFEPYNDMLTTRGDEQKNQAMEYYNQKNYAKAAQVFEQVIETQNEPLLKLYYGISMMQNGHAEKAASYLESQSQNVTDKMVQEPFLWYAGLAYVANKESTKARMQFQKLLNASPFYKTRAEKILSELN